MKMINFVASIGFRTPKKAPASSKDKACENEAKILSALGTEGVFTKEAAAKAFVGLKKRQR